MKRKLLRFSLAVFSLVAGMTAQAQYCTSTASSNFDTEIWNVTLVGQSMTINQSSGALGSGLSGKYTNNTALVADVVPTLSYTVSTQTGDDGSGPTYYSRRTSVYIDWNQDFDFLDAGELIGTSPYAGGAPISYNFNVTVPMTAVTGTTRMRVVTIETTGVPASCGTYTYGETEDYSIQVLPLPSCLPVSGVTVTGITATTASVNWTLLDGLQTNWIIEYGFDGFTPGSGTFVPTSTIPTVLTGLNPETSYDVIVYADCGGGDISYPSATISFNTPALCPVPSGLTTTGITTTSANLDWNPGSTETMWDVEWGLNGFLLGSGIQDYGLTASADALTTLSAVENYHWYVRAVCDLNVGDGVDTVSYFVGPVAFSTPASCIAPSGLNVTNNNGFQSDLGWTAGGLETEWNIQWGPSGFTLNGAGANLITNVTSNPTTVTGLTPNTAYQFYIQAVCGSGGPDDLSSWTGPFTWTSSAFCSTPSGLGTSVLGTDNAMLDWTENGTSSDWTVEYGVSGFTPGTGTSVQVNTTPVLALTGLTPDTEYCFYVQSNCGSTADSSSAWAGPFCFTTTSSCPAPSNLGAMNITNTAANLIFQAGGSETMWDIEWGNPGFTPGAGEELGSVAGTSDNPYYATGLNESAPYQYYVRAVCGGSDGNSVWVGPYSFNTLMTNNQPCGAIEIIVNDPQVQHYNTGTSLDAGEVVPPIVTTNCLSQTSWCSTPSGRSVWFSFKAPSTGAVEVSTFGDLTYFRTQIAVYATGDCAIYANYDLLGANTLDPGSSQPPYGSTLSLCGLTPGESYYIKVESATTTGPGNFGIGVDAIDPNVEAGNSIGAEICENTGSFDLFTTINGNSTTEGVWYNPSPAPGNEMPSTVDFTGVTPGTYPIFYVDGSACGSDTVETFVTVVEAPDAGSNGVLTTCNTLDIVLVQQLNGSPEMGGVWSDDDNAGGLDNGLFDAFGVPAGIYDFTYTVNGGIACPDATATVTITLTDCLEIDETEVAQLSVYPNPVSEVLTIQNLSIETGVIDVMDIQGKVVYSIQVNGVNGNYELNMNELQSGVYVVRITTENSIQEVRVVKQ